MHIDFVRAHNVELSDALRQYVEKRLGQVSNKYIDENDESAACKVEIGRTTEHHRSGDVYRAEFNLHVAGKDLYAAAEKDDLYAAIDEAKDELTRQLKHYREKKQTLLRKGGLKLKQMLQGRPRS